MPQTSPMNWILISYMIFLFLMLNQTMFSLSLSKKMLVSLKMNFKNWLW